MLLEQIWGSADVLETGLGKESRGLGFHLCQVSDAKNFLQDK